MSEGMPDEAALDLDGRQLCPDGNCVGVIGEGGRCKVCGRAADGGLPGPHAPAPMAADDTNEAGDWPPDLAAPDLAARKLCPDGNCVGVIGDDGRCKACGLPEP